MYYVPRKRPNRPLSIVLASLMVLAGLYCLRPCLEWEHDGEVETQRFQAAPVCSNRSPATSPPCRFYEPMLVTNKWVEYGTKGSRKYYLDLRSAAGRTYREEINGATDTWDKASINQPVEAQVWRGDVITATAGGLTAATDEYPGFAAEDWSVRYAFVWMCVIWMFLWILPLISAIRLMAAGR